MEKKLIGVIVSYGIMKAKLELDVATAKTIMVTLRVKYEMGEARVKALVFKHWKKLIAKVEAALSQGCNEWATQAAELQIFRVDAENGKKEGRGFYKMDENSIQILREDLTEKFQALARTHHSNSFAMGTLQVALPTPEETQFRQALQYTICTYAGHSTLDCPSRPHWPICHSRIHTIEQCAYNMLNRIATTTVHQIDPRPNLVQTPPPAREAS